MCGFTAAEKQACAERETRYRRAVYARRIVQGRMRAETAEREIALMEAIADDYRRADDSERSAEDLFGNERDA